MAPALEFVQILKNAIYVLSENMQKQLTPVLGYFVDNHIARMQGNNRRRGTLFNLVLL